jgi:4-hydroxythreonine-4-phosphate dehydrogenase
LSTERPLIGITMGDPAGIGPEIAVKALAHRSVYDLCRPVLVADEQAISRAIKITGGSQSINLVSRVEDAVSQPDVIDVYPLQGLEMELVLPGKISAAAGHAAFVSVTSAIELAMQNRIAAVVTGPLHKEALRLAGHHFPGHTEIFAHYTGTPRYTMMLAEDNFRVVHVSTHVSLRNACDAVKKERVLEVIELAHEAMLRLGLAQPRIGVAGLNPHAGDGGLFGGEEQNEIIPAIERARGKGMIVEGPFPPDTFYPRAVTGTYDICVAMYHDQGHIPVKLSGFKYDRNKQAWQAVNGINVTLGLPIIRTSVDHGTAFDLAGKGTASERSMLDAIDFAARLAGGVCVP